MSETYENTKWYYSVDGQRARGPVNKAHIIRLFESRAIDPSALVWRKGFDDWLPISEVEELANALPRTPPPLPKKRPSKANNQLPRSDSPPTKNIQHSHTTANQTRTFLGGIYHPWRRLFATHIDIILATLLAFFLIGFVLAFFDPETADVFVEFSESNLIFIGILGTFFNIFFRTVLLSTWGTTPGKLLFGITVSDLSGHKLTGSQAFRRELDLWIRGLGLGIPIVILITQLVAYSNLTKTGSTAWDEAHDCLTQHITWSPGRALLAVISTILIFGFAGMLSSDGSPTHQTGSQDFTNSPSTYQSYSGVDASETKPIAIENNCFEAVTIALYYYSPQREWVTNGWWVAQSNETFQTNKSARKPEIYIFAFSDNYRWEGDQSSDSSIGQYVIAESFTATQLQPIASSDKALVQFIPAYVQNTSDSYIVTLSCN